MVSFPASYVSLQECKQIQEGDPFLLGLLVTFQEPKCSSSGVFPSFKRFDKSSEKENLGTSREMDVSKNRGTPK